MVTAQDVSELFDSEVERDKLPSLLGALEHDARLREQWTVFAMISDAMAGVAWPDDGYSLRLSERLRDVQIDPDYDPLKPR